MIRIPLGYHVDPAKFIDYMIWLTERNLADAWHKYDKACVVEFKNEQDAVAFKLRFGL